MTTIRERAIVGPTHIESDFLPRAAVAWFDESFADRRALLQAGDALAERLAYTGLAMHYLHGDFGLWDECENVECRKDCAAAARWRKVVG